VTEPPEGCCELAIEPAFASNFHLVAVISAAQFKLILEKPRGSRIFCSLPSGFPLGIKPQAREIQPRRI